ncbi:hypothetical protein BGZ54_004093 [Gamsiella multidivaricata]|nr:hypothetical protein BGZ54_004093 [Gamsiella multidivaricata]
MFGRRRTTKFRFRALVILYFAMGCIIPYYVMRHAQEEGMYQKGLLSRNEEEQQRQQDFSVRQGQVAGDGKSTASDASNPKDYRRKAFFQNVDEVEASFSVPTHPAFQERQQNPVLYSIHTLLHDRRQSQDDDQDQDASSSPISQQLQLLREMQQSQQKEILVNLSSKLAMQRKLAKLTDIKTVQMYATLMQTAIKTARDFVLTKMPEEYQFFEERIPGTKLDTVGKTRRFRQLMDQALNQGRWVYEPYRDYPEFGGATGWNKKKKNERDRDVAINRPPFPEAGKYHWKPIVNSVSTSAGATGRGWHANRIHPDDFCRTLGPRHIVLVGDLIHWQLHDSIMYNMFDTPQVCYGDLTCHFGAGHPLCPLPNNVHLKFVRNDLLSPIRPHKSRLNETKIQDPVEMAWLRDMKLKDTVILGAIHQTMPDKQFMQYLTDTVKKIRMARPEALVIYRNNPVGHPDCPSKVNKFNSDKAKRHQVEIDGNAQAQEQQLANNSSDQRAFQARDKTPLVHNRSTFSAPAQPFDQDIPIAEMLDYPLNWAHYDRQNQMAKEIVEATGGIYWNVATMTNMRPDGHVGGHDCLSYKRPGPTDEWAVSLYNLFRTIELVEREPGK